MLKILHTGDVHLDTPFSTLDPSHAEIRRNELRGTFTSMLHYARTENFDMILISGDLFDAIFVTRDTIAMIKSEFSKISCPIVISPGNHDSVSEASVWRQGIFPDNTYIFDRPELQYFDFPELNTRVWGWAFTSRTMTVSPLTGRRADEDSDGTRINLLCAHGDLTSPLSVTCPLTVAELEAFGADYAALGHIHSPEDYGDRIAYCGCLEGRTFNETGIKGVIDVTVDGDRIVSRRVPLAKRRFEERTLRVSGAATNTELKSRIESFIASEGLGDETVLRLTLTGEVDPSLVLNRTLLEKDSRVFVLMIADETSPLLNADELRRDPTVRGEFFRLLEGRLNSADPEERRLAADALRVGLAALAGEAVTEV